MLIILLLEHKDFDPLDRDIILHVSTFHLWFLSHDLCVLRRHLLNSNYIKIKLIFVSKRNLVNPT